MRGRPYVMSGLVAGLSVIVGACDDSIPTRPPAAGRAGGAAAAPSVTSGIDGEFARLSAEVPGFAGMFLDESGRLNVYVKDAGERGLGKAEIARRLSGREGAGRGTRIAGVSA